MTFTSSTTEENRRWCIEKVLGAMYSTEAGIVPNMSKVVEEARKLEAYVEEPQKAEA